jgi:hypothetical protein
MKALIINYNRLTLPRLIAEWCVEHGLTPVFVDNNSDYPPLMDFYHHAPFMVMHLNKNYGHTAVWLPECTVLERLGILDEPYIVTDSDLDLSGVPADFLKVMQAGLNKYPKYDKCGLSLEVNDLPDTPEGRFIPQCEGRYWQRPLDEVYFDAPTDTTFALYKAGVREYNHNAIRVNRPYTAKHVPWYYDDLSKLPEDEQYYFKTASERFSTGKKRLVV